MRVLVVFLVLLQFLVAASFTFPDFRQCYNKNRDSIVYFKDTKALAISSHYAVAYSTKTPKAKFIKFDPFLNLYLFYSKDTLKPVKLKSVLKLSLGEWLASMDEDSLYIGNFAKKGNGLEEFYEQNSKTPKNSMISCLCCEVYGLGIGDGKFIPTKFLKRFLNSKEIFYGDIGVRFAKIGKKIVVSKIDPFYPKELLKTGDIIKKIDSKSVKSLRDLREIILFSKLKSSINIEFLRDGVLHKRTLMVIKRFGGGNLSDTFLESKGLFFDSNLKIKWIKEGTFGSRSGLKVGDKLLQINSKSVKSFSDIQKVLSNAKEVVLLFDRDDFQFFVKVK